MFKWVKELYCRFLNSFKGGRVNKCKCSCDDKQQEITIKFEPLEINLNVNIRVVPPDDDEPKIKGELTLGPVSEKSGKEK